MRRFVAPLIILLMAPSLYANDKVFWTLAAGAQAATIYDVESTMRTMQRCPICSEGNPIMRPFVSTKPGAYSVAAAFNSAGIYGSFKMKERGSKWWWVPMAAQIGMHTAFGIRNSRIH